MKAFANQHAKDAYSCYQSARFVAYDSLAYKSVKESSFDVLSYRQAGMVRRSPQNRLQYRNNINNTDTDDTNNKFFLVSN